MFNEHRNRWMEEHFFDYPTQQARYAAYDKLCDELVERIRAEHEFWAEQVIGSGDGNDLRTAQLLDDLLSMVAPA